MFKTELQNLGNSVQVGSIANLDEITIHHVNIENMILCDFENDKVSFQTLPNDIFEERQLDRDSRTNIIQDNKEDPTIKKAKTISQDKAIMNLALY